MNQNPLLIAMLLSGLISVPLATAQDAGTPAPPAQTKGTPAAPAHSAPDQGGPAQAAPAAAAPAHHAAPQAQPVQAEQKAAEKSNDKDAQKAEKQERDKADRAEKERLAKEKSEKQERDRAEKSDKEKADREQKAQADKQAKADKKAKDDEKANAFTPMPLLDYIKTPDMKASWGTILKSELSIPAWIQSLDADSGPISQIPGPDGSNYVIGAMNKAGDPYDRMIALFSSDHKKQWGLGVTIPIAIGKEGLMHPKKYASLRWYGRPDLTIRKVFTDYLDKDPSWKM